MFFRFHTTHLSPPPSSIYTAIGIFQRSSTISCQHRNWLAYYFSHPCLIMVDTKLSSLLPKWRQASSPHETLFKQIPSRVASWFTAMRGPVLANKGPCCFPETSSPWDRLMASSPLQPHSPAASTAIKFIHQKGALTGSLLVRLT